MHAQGQSSRTVFTDIHKVVSPRGCSSSQVMKISDLIPDLFHTDRGWVAFGSFSTECATAETLWFLISSCSLCKTRTISNCGLTHRPYPCLIFFILLYFLSSPDSNLLLNLLCLTSPIRMQTCHEGELSVVAIVRLPHWSVTLLGQMMYVLNKPLVSEEWQVPFQPLPPSIQMTLCFHLLSMWLI